MTPLLPELTGFPGTLRHHARKGSWDQLAVCPVPLSKWQNGHSPQGSQAEAGQVLATCRVLVVRRGLGAVGQLPGLSWVHRQVDVTDPRTSHQGEPHDFPRPPGGFWVAPAWEARTVRSCPVLWRLWDDEQSPLELRSGSILTRG